MIEILNIDCMDYMSNCEDNAFDLAIVDPPYFEGPNNTGYYGNGYSSLGVERSAYYGKCADWDIPRKEYFVELERVSKNQIVWGANHLCHLFNAGSASWIVWDKDNGSSSFADAELAFTSFPSAVRIFKYTWNGMHQGQYGGDKRKNVKRIHPTQKPTQLYDWLLRKFSEPGQKIIDTHLGSGSSAIAAHYFGVDFVGCELDPVHYQSARNRFNDETAQMSLAIN